MAVSFSVIIRAMFIIVMLTYPVLIYMGLEVLNIRIIAMLLLGVMMVRFYFMPNTPAVQKWGMLGGAAVIAGLVLVFNDPLYLKLYPVMMSVLMFGVFTMSLITPPTVIETFARLHYKGKILPPHVVPYTRNVTKIWCGFFVLNACIALYTVSQPIEIWTLYNGLISYFLMGFLFIGELLFRVLIMKKRVGDV